MFTIDEIKMGMSTFFNPVLSNTKKKKNPTAMAKDDEENDWQW